MSDAKTSINIDHLANLARLNFEPEAAEHARQDLEKIIAMIDAMQAVDTDGIARFTLDSSQRLRKDAATEVEQRDKFQANAPSTAEGYYLVLGVD